MGDLYKCVYFVNNQGDYDHLCKINGENVNK